MIGLSFQWDDTNWLHRAPFIQVYKWIEWHFKKKKIVWYFWTFFNIWLNVWMNATNRTDWKLFNKSVSSINYLLLSSNCELYISIISFVNYSLILTTKWKKKKKTDTNTARERIINIGFLNDFLVHDDDTIFKQFIIISVWLNSGLKIEQNLLLHSKWCEFFVRCCCFFFWHTNIFR